MLQKEIKMKTSKEEKNVGKGKIKNREAQQPNSFLQWELIMF